MYVYFFVLQPCVQILRSNNCNDEKEYNFISVNNKHTNTILTIWQDELTTIVLSCTVSILTNINCSTYM